MKFLVRAMDRGGGLLDVVRTDLICLIAELIRYITDPEHKSMTLEQLMVVSAPQCTVSNATNRVVVEFTPTVPHCGMSTVIGKLVCECTSREIHGVSLLGLTIRVRLLRALPDRFKVDIRVKPGSHNSVNDCE
jgi:hypothetical protein